MNFQKKLDSIVEENDSLVCVGLDSNFEKLPSRFKKVRFPQYSFNKWIVQKTHDLVCAYKANMAFYEARGDRGIRELKMTMEYLLKKHPQIVTIVDAKRGDIGSTNMGYVSALFDWFSFDGVTLHPYLGGEALQPFLGRKDKGCIILCRTSNPGAGELQDLLISRKPLWQIVAKKVRDEWNTNNNCMLVVGATYPKELTKIRKIVGNMTLLVPGVGVQGADVGKTVRAGLNSKGLGMIINSSCGIIFSENPRMEAKKLRDEINKYRVSKRR